MNPTRPFKNAVLVLALAHAAGCTTDDIPAGDGESDGIEHYRGAWRETTPELHTGTIATREGEREITYELIDGLAIVEGDIIVPWSDFVEPGVAHAAAVTRSST